MLQSGVLVRVLSPSDTAVHQTVATVVFRPRLLQITHEIPAAGRFRRSQNDGPFAASFCQIASDIVVLQLRAKRVVTDLF